MNRFKKMVTQFSLRFLLIGIIPLSIPLGWVGSHLHHHRIEKQFLHDLVSSTTQFGTNSCSIESEGARVFSSNMPVLI